MKTQKRKQEKRFAERARLVVGCALALGASVSAGVETTRIVAGETVSVQPSTTAYAYYRLVIKRIADKVAWEPDSSADLGSHKWVRIREIGLYDAEGHLLSEGLEATTADLADMPFGSCRFGGRIGTGSGADGEDPSRLFDGRSAEVSAWCNPNPAANYAWTWGYVYVRLPQGSPPVAAYNLAMSAAEYEVGAWSFEGSADGETWTVLDELSEEASLPYRAADSLSDFGWYNGGEPFRVWQSGVNPSARHFAVERGGTLLVVSDAVLGGVSSYGGEIVIAADATATIDVGEGHSAQLLGGGLAGAGVLEKSGAGALAVSGVNSDFAGTVKVSGGILRFVPMHLTPRYEVYRFVAKKKPSDEKLKLSELALYDAAGNRLNGGLSYVDYAVATNPSGTVMSMPEVASSRAGQCDPWTGDANIFDGDLATAWYGWVQPSEASWAWLNFYMRPGAASAAPVAYNVASSPDNLYNPITWALQGTMDGIVWETLDEMTEARRAGIFPDAAQSWCNGGVPISFLAEGDHAPTGEVSAKYFRLSIKAFGTSGTGGTRAISEFGLYDRTGRRVNLNLVNSGRDVEVSSLPAGSFTYHNSTWEPTWNGDSTRPEKMFDGDLSTRMSGWNFAACTLEENWITFTLRLADDVPPVAAYSLVAYSPNNANMTPCAWQVEASADGVNWLVVDARSGDEAEALLPPSTDEKPAYYNNARPIGFAQNCGAVLVPYRATFAVGRAARLELPEGSEAIRSLSVDLTELGSGCGTIARLKAAAEGAIYLTHKRKTPRFAETELLAFEDLVDGANLLNWAVYVNGVRKDCYTLKLVDGRLVIDGGYGFALIIR